MRVVIDNYAVLKAIGSNPSAFDSIDDLVRKQTKTFLVAAFKHKSLTLEEFRAMCGALGMESTALFFDEADDSLIKAICKKCDPHAAELKAGNVEDMKRLLLAVAKGRAPTDKPSKPKPTKGAAKSKGTSAEFGATLPHAITTKPPR